MKRTIKTILCAAAAVLAAVSCQKSVEPVQTAEEGKGTIDICVNGLMGEYTQQDGVKSSLVNNVRVAWAAGDVVYVFDGSKYLGKLTATLDKKADGQTDEDRYAKLGGTISAPATTPCVLSLVHSSLMTEPAAGAEVSELSIDMSAQSTETAPFVAYATMDYTGESISDVVVPFQFATSVIKVNCTGLKANTAITSATLSNVNTTCKLTLASNAAPSVSGDVNGTITRTGDSYFAGSKVNGEGEAVFQIAVPILETASGARVLTVAQGSDKVKDKKFTTNSLAAAISVNTVCQLVGPPTYVEIGGVKWATKNLGATTVADSYETCAGDYYAWGVTEPYYGTLTWSGTTGTFTSWKTGKADGYAWQSYCGSSSFTEWSTAPYDSKTKILKPDFDAAKQKLGDDWRMPTSADFQALYNACGGAYDKKTYKSVTCGESSTFSKGVYWCGNYDGVAGLLFIAEDNGPHLFFPAAGYGYGTTLNDAGSGGRYWSSSLYTSYTSYAYRLNFNNGEVIPTSSGYRYYGSPVRPVSD